jgi:hypothetical protein
MASVPRVALGGDTLNRKWWIDYNNGTHASPSWIPVSGVLDFQPVLAPVVQDDSDFDSGGYKSNVVTALDWSCTLKVARKATAASATIYDPGQEAIRAAANNTGAANSVEIRWYEMNVDSTGAVVGPKVEAWQGYAVVSWGEDGGAMDALDSASVTMNGRGARTAITHPESVAAVPTVTALSTNAGAAAGGTLVMLTGTGFTGTVATTGVKFGATNAPTWAVVSDNVIWVVAPAHVAAAVNVVVTNATGPSISTATFTYS